MERALVLGLVIVACAALYALSRMPKKKAPRTVTTLRRELDKLTHEYRMGDAPR